MWEAGEKIYAKDTATIRNCGIDCKRARGYVTFVDNQFVSFYLDRGNLTGGIEAVCRIEVFGWNFQADPFSAGKNLGYIKKEHFTRRFPDVFLVSNLDSRSS